MLNMKTLAYTNPYLRDPLILKQRIEESAYQSSVVEGAEGLVRLRVYKSSTRCLAATISAGFDSKNRRYLLNCHPSFK